MPQLESVLGLVQSDLQNARYSSAMRRLVSISNECSHDIQFLSLLSATQKALGDQAGHIKTLSIIAGKTKTAAAQLDLMMALYVEGRLNEALDVGLALQENNLLPVQAQYLTRLLIKIYLEFSDYEGVEEALSAYQTRAEPDDVMKWGMGLVYLARDEKNSALDCFRNAVTLNPQNESAWVSLALLHEEMGDRELALANMARALDVNPRQPTALKMMMRWQQNSKTEMNQLMERVDFYLKGADFDEELEICYIDLLKRQNAIDEAHFEIQKVLLFNPESARLQKIKNDVQGISIS